MTLPPIVERELRLAARRRLTFWMRVSVASLTLLIFGGLLALQMIFAASRLGATPFNMGQVQFGILRWLSFIAACSAGVFLTADSLSAEKREGTLGLLFLTDLRGHDVVLGKLASTSLQAFYGLLAAFPVLGLTLLEGGVSGLEFGRAMLTICNTLFFSLAAGLLVSSISRDVIKAMNGTLLFCLLFLVGLWLTDLALAGWDSTKVRPFLSLASPVYLFSEAAALPARDYWFCLALQHLLGWGFLLLSCLFAPRAWQEKPASSEVGRVKYSDRWRFGGPRFRRAWRRKLLTPNPILWLVLRDRWLPRVVRVVTLIALTVLGLIIARRGDFAPLRAAAMYFLTGCFNLGLILWMASQACRFFVEGAGGGALELVLVAPVEPKQIVQSQWSALWRTFLVPALFVILLQIGGGIMMMKQMSQSLAGTSVPPGFNFLHLQLASMIVGVVNFIGNLSAVGWLGMWMGLTNRKTPVAVLKTLALAFLLPGMVLAFAQGIMMGLFVFVKLPFWFGIVVSGGLSLGKNIFFIVWSRRRLLRNFREAVLGEGNGPAFRQAPPLVPVG